MGKKQKYDDYYSNGKVEIGRFGNSVFSKNHYTKEEIQRRNKQFASHYDDIKTDIDNTIVEIVDKVKKCNPLILLQNATDLFMMSFLQAVSEIQVEDNARYIEYIQSILVSIKPGNEIVDDKLQSKIMQELFNDIDKLYTKCQHFYIVWAAKAQENDGYRREDIEYIIEAQLMSNVRGKRYQCQQLDDLEKLILPHTKKMEEVYNVTAVDFIEGLRKLEYSLSSAKLDAAKGLANEYKIFQQEVQSKSDHEVDSISDRIQNDGKKESLMSKCFGTELYDVKKVTGWSEELVKSLSWELGENDSFFTKTEFPGWPVQNLPVQRRPFIVIDGVSYCFDYYNLFDNIYRILQKSIIAKDNKYANTWSDIQKEASESLVAEKLSMLMPNADIYIGNYYPIGSSLKQMDENDIIAVCDDIIIIAEVKAGSFAYTPALTDLTAHKKSFKELIGKADYQCVRTLEYINKCVDNVCFYTEEKNKKKTQYVLKDFMFKFWYEFIPKATSVIEMGHGDIYYEKAVKPNLHSYMGSVFEEMCRYYTLEQGICGKFDNFITRVGSWWGNETLESKDGKKYQQSTDIDIVAVSDIDKTAVVGECKFKNEPIGKEIYDTLLRRSKLISGKYRISKYLLFSLSGYTSWFDELNDGNLRMFTLAELYE